MPRRRQPGGGGTCTMAMTGVRRAAITLVVVLALTALATPVTQAMSDPRPCRVRNVTQDAVGRSFRRMVAAAVDGDTLRVRGSCRARHVLIATDLVIRGVGARRPALDAGG